MWTRLLRPVWETSSLLAGPNGVSESGWITVQWCRYLHIAKISSGALHLYGFDIDWSLDGSTVAVTETVSLSDNVPVERGVSFPVARFRVRNLATPGPATFATHRTYVQARGG